MALSFDFRKVKDSETLHSNEAESQKTDACIWLTMILGINALTEKTIDKFYKRYLMYNRVWSLYSGMTKEDFIRRIGLETNASNYSDAKFGKIIVERLSREAK